MPDLQALITFPGINQVLGASLTIGHGIAPSTFRIDIVPQQEIISEGGMLVVSFGAVTYRFTGCKIVSGSYQRNAAGFIVGLNIEDRRWTWRGGGAICGSYNIWRADASIEDGSSKEPGGAKRIDTRKTPRELLAMCLDALGEYGYDLSRVPNDTHPTVDWDYDDPALAMEDLCEELGCRVVMRLDNSVAICRSGEGADLPDGGVMDDSVTVDPPEIPAAISIVCPAVYQYDFPLEAVGIDVPDGPLLFAPASSEDLLKPIDELSYKPKGGWETYEPYCSNVGRDSKGKDVTGLRYLAIKSVFKYYRIKLPIFAWGFDADPPTGRKGKRKKGEKEGVNITNIEQLELMPQLVDIWFQNRQATPLPPRVFGVYSPGGGVAPYKNSVRKLRPAPQFPPTLIASEAYSGPYYLGGYSLDLDRGLVIFDEPVFRNELHDTDDAPNKIKIAPAKMVLRCACMIRDENRMSLGRYERTRLTGSKFDTPTKFERRDEIVKTLKVDYKDTDAYDISDKTKDTRPKKEITENTKRVNEECDFHLDNIMAEIQTNAAQQRSYMGIIKVELDGAIQQVSMELGYGSPARTTVSRNTEGSQVHVSYKERRWMNRQAAAEAQARKEKKIQRAKNYVNGTTPKGRPKGGQGAGMF